MRSSADAFACCTAAAVHARLQADSPDLAAHIADLTDSAPRLTAASEQQPSVVERSAAWSREWHPRFPLPSPASDPPLMWRDAAGSWGAVPDSQVPAVMQHAGDQPAYTVSGDPSPVTQPMRSQLSGQGAVPLHFVLPNGSVGVLAANVGGQQGSWQPVLVAPATPVMALAGPVSHQNGLDAQRRAAATAAPQCQHKLLPAGVAAPRHAGAKRGLCLPDAGGGSNQAAARMLRERMQKRSKPADAAAIVSTNDQTAACISQPEATTDACVKSTSQLVPDGDDDVHRQIDPAEASASLTKTNITAHNMPYEAAGPAAELGAGPNGAAVPECLRRMAEAGDDSEVVFLGTGCAEPSKYRGASGILLRYCLCDGPTL